MSELRTIPIVPNGLRYWVLPDKKAEATIQVGDVTLTGGADIKEPPIQGRVVAVGDAEKPSSVEVDTRGDYRLDRASGRIFPLRHGEDIPRSACKYKHHDLVIYGKYAGSPHVFEGVEYTILHEEEILGLVIETPFDTRDNTPLSPAEDPELR